MKVVEYLDPSGQSPFESWFRWIEARAAAKVNRRGCTTGSRQSFQHEVRRQRRTGIPHRLRPGYRVYFGRDGDTLVILLAGGTKQRQRWDIADAHARWLDYKRRKRGD